MTKLLPCAQWVSLRTLYAVGKRGIAPDGRRDGDAGPWPVLMKLRAHDPPLAREVYRPNTRNEPQYFVVITEAGKRFYEENEKQHDLFYPPEE